MISLSGELSKWQRAHEVIEATSTAARLVLHPLFAPSLLPCAVNQCKELMEKLAAARTNQFIDCSSVQVVVINHGHWGEGNLKVCQLKVVCE